MFKSFGHFLRTVQMADDGIPSAKQNQAFEQLRSAAAGSSEAVPADGGFAVLPEFTGRLIERMYQTGEILQRCTEIPITKPSANGIIFPQFNETSRANGSRMGGLQAFWANEADSATASHPRFSRGELTLKKLIALVYLTNELYADTDAMAIFVEAGFAKEMAFVLENAIVSGSGVARPLGILNSPALISVSKQTEQVPGTIVAQNVVDAWARMWAPSRKTAVWLTNVEAEKQLLTLALPVGTGGSEIPLYKTTTDPETQPYNTMLGRPVIPVEYCPAAGTPGDLMLVDCSRYLVAMKEAMKAAASLHVRFLSDEMAFRFTLRVDGQPIDAQPITPLNGTVTQSPFVCIAQR